jgi:hypothetical protein
VHRFGRPAGVPYPLFIEDKLRNYVIGFTELGLDLAPVLEHFAEHLPAEKISATVEEALGRGVCSPPPGLVSGRLPEAGGGAAAAETHRDEEATASVDPVSVPTPHEEAMPEETRRMLEPEGEAASASAS